MDSKFSLEFNSISDSIDEAYMAIGMISENMFDFAIRKLENAALIHIVLGVHMPTHPNVFKKIKSLSDEKKLDAAVYVRNFFHPKLYLFKIRKEWIAYVGSGNFTNGGWSKNEELFTRITCQQTCTELYEKFLRWKLASQQIDQRFIDIYERNFNTYAELQKDTVKFTDDLTDKLQEKFNIDNVDFTEQFFSKKHHMAFRPGITHMDSPDVLEERKEVRKRLYLLDALISSKIPPGWKIYHHYDIDHIVSHIYASGHDDLNVRSLWVGYGRNKAALKQYHGNDSTPLNFMRMQVIVHYDSVGFWLMPGKLGAGQIDRSSFLEKMENEETQRYFFRHLKSLGKEYWIEVAGEKRPCESFTDHDELASFIKRDDFRNYYFIIGRDYQLGATALRSENIVLSCIADFTKYKPLYDLIKDSTFG
ncbi:phospholipase D family protein [Pedobacter endophyticus]|uniref:Phospholipase D family protein n=1 Tax=Pedobacter endophyticus TaxID=2789740 RepID=A0A7U3Q3F5_9SPHI|nr:phospholipase D family protein [Pedobacter endophyticus]QPH37860.1 phospholipase D family protein [Pedobacter endophyticus]